MDQTEALKKLVDDCKIINDGVDVLLEQNARYRKTAVELVIEELKSVKEENEKLSTALENQVELIIKYMEALEEIADKKTQCIFSSNSCCMDASHRAFQRVAEIAEQALSEMSIDIEADREGIHTRPTKEQENGTK